jgi:hypothetical protein
MHVSRGGSGRPLLVLHHDIEEAPSPLGDLPACWQDIAVRLISIDDHLKLSVRETAAFDQRLG